MEKPYFCLIGTSRILPIKGTSEGPIIEFYSELIPRLLTEVHCGNTLSRLGGFRAVLSNEEYWQFLGIEVEQPSDIPDGLECWLLYKNAGKVVSRAGTSEHPINDWLWLDVTRPFTVGEFHASFPFERPGLRPFYMTTNSYIGAPNTPAAEDTIQLEEYNPSWPQQFAEMASYLRDLLPNIITRIVHYGSTAIPGIPAKPIIDILVEVPSFESARSFLLPVLNEETWEYWWYTDHMIFIKRDRLMGTRTHHVHIAPPAHRLWEGVAFRDYLRTHPETAREYATLKQELSLRFRTDREKYTDAKTAFVRFITDKALSSLPL